MEDLKTNRIPHISKDPHVVVAIHGCDDLWYLEGCEERGRALLEWLFLRLYVFPNLCLEPGGLSKTLSNLAVI